MVYTATDVDTGVVLPTTTVMIYAYGITDEYTSDADGKITLSGLICGVS